MLGVGSGEGLLSSSFSFLLNSRARLTFWSLTIAKAAGGEIGEILEEEIVSWRRRSLCANVFPAFQVGSPYFYIFCLFNLLVFTLSLFGIVRIGVFR